MGIDDMKKRVDELTKIINVAREERKRLVYKIRYREKTKSTYDCNNTVAHEFIGKKVKDFTPEELKAYHHNLYLLRKNKKNIN